MRTGDLVGRAALAGRDHDEELHDTIVDPALAVSQVPDEHECPLSLGAPALDHKDILVADGAS